MIPKDISPVSDHRTVPRTCPACLRALDGAMAFQDGGEPTDGALSICAYCAHLAIFDGPELRLPTPAEMADITTDLRVMAILAVTQRMVANRGQNHQPETGATE